MQKKWILVILFAATAQLSISFFIQPVQSVAQTVSSVFVTNDPSDPIPTSERAKTRILSFLDKPFQAKFDHGGFAPVEVSSGNSYLSALGFREACFLVGHSTGGFHTTGITVLEGKFEKSEYLYAARIVEAPLGQIHCIDIRAPQLQVLLRGDPETEEPVLLWIYLTS